ncbi:hypothetical protein RAD15_15240 [Bradyrhizobium sp. 14AA]
MTFEPATNTGPHTITTFSTPNDPTAVLPDAAAAKFVRFVQRCRDHHAAVPGFADLQEQSHAVIRHKKRIDDLTRPKSEGFHGLPELAPQVVIERRELERAEAELSRLASLKEIRGARWNTAKQLEARVIDWVMRGGIPTNCIIEPIEDPPLSELLKKGETIADAVDRFRHRLRELTADAHRVRSAPWPSSVVKQEAKAQLEQIAEAATPNFDSMIEHHAPLVLPRVSLSSLVPGVEPTLAFAEITDPRLVCRVLMEQVLAKVYAGLDEAADDKHALDQQQRERMEAQISEDVLAIERSEVACIWHAEANKGEVIDFRPDTSPQALLGVTLRTVPRSAPSGTSAQHAINIVGARR